MSRTRFVRQAAILGLSLACSGFLLAETFLVINDSDQIPAEEGTLRWAIERSEENPGPDRIEFAMDFAQIVLVDELPELLDGGLTLVSSTTAGVEPAPPSAYTISGELGVVRALAIRSADNRIGELRFVSFSGREAVLVAGEDALKNRFSGCWFGDPEEALGNTEAGVRIAPDDDGSALPDETSFDACAFSANGVAIEVDGTNSPSLEPASRTVIRRSWFGTDADGRPGPGNGEAIRSTGGALSLTGSRLTGPGHGVSILGPSDASFISRNTFGGTRADGTPCQGFEGAALFAEGSTSLVVDTNHFLCGKNGIQLGIGADHARVNNNVFGERGENPLRLSGDAVILDGADGCTVSRSLFLGVDGSGISAPGAAGPHNLLTCNIARSVGGQVIFQAEPQVTPPQDLQSEPLRLDGIVDPQAPGWIEVFTEDATRAATFLGSMEKIDNTEQFSYLLPAGLTLRRSQDQPLRLRVWGDKATHTSTWTPSDLGETSEASLALPITTNRPVFDLVRGDVDHLAPIPAGGVDLGPVTCLARGIPEGSEIDDPEWPVDGKAFFYLSRRRHPEDTGLTGLYDSPLCLDLLAGSLGARIEGPGGCDE